MSRPKNYWYNIVKKMVYRYPRLLDGSDQEKRFREAIEKSIDKTRTEIDGEEKVKAINIVCFEKCLTVDGAAKQMNYSHNTIQRWINRFINDVGKNAGF